MVNILVAEDEEILRVSLVKKLTLFWPEANIIGAAECGSEALQMLNELKPDIAFLDIQMGDLTAIELLKEAQHNCHIVFVTAYDKYAIQAFDNGAVDYLLKPYSDKRLQDCIARLKSRLGALSHEVTNVLRSAVKKDYLTKVRAQIGNKLWFINVCDVICFKACGRYIEVVTKEREFLLKMPLKTISEQLEPESFWQVHRSTIINIELLEHVRNADTEHMLAYMQNYKEPIKISRSFAHQFRHL